MIQVNGRFTGQRVTGVQCYAREIIEYFPNEEFKLLSPISSWSSGIKGHLWEQLALPGRLSNDDLLWSPGNVGPLSVNNQVVTIHDLSTIEHPEWFSASFAKWYSWILPKLVHRVRHIITESEFTRGRLVDLLGVPNNKISVIANGVANNFKPESVEVIQHLRAKYNLPEKYILYVGSLEPRKNLQRLFAAWQLLNKSDNRTHLVVVGATGHVFTQDSSIDTYIDKVDYLGYVDAMDLPGIYSGAEIFVYPSLYEGFGLPLLEAMACGTAVITSDLAPLNDVAGDCAILVDPNSEQALSEAIEYLLNNKDIRMELSNKGIQHAARFDWENAASETWSLLERLS